MPEKYSKHGLEPFLSVGYLMVAVFLFFSGYGLYKSVQTKENYLRGFFGKRLTRLVLVYIISLFFFTYMYMNVGINPDIQGPFTLFGARTLNPYGWFFYAIILCYVLFYHAFKRIRSETGAMIAVTVGIVLYMLFCNYFLYADFWYNTILIFPFGLFFAKTEEKIVRLFQKRYGICLAAAAAIALLLFACGEHIAKLLRNTDFLFGYMAGQMMLALIRNGAGAAFVLTMLLVARKVKFENGFLRYLGSVTLEFYLLHGIFVQYFASECASGFQKAGRYIPNPFVYLLVVSALTLGCSFLCRFAVELILNWMKKSIYAEMMAKTLVRIMIAGLIIVVFFSVKTKRDDIRETNARKDAFQKFSDSQSRVEISDGKMAYFIEGDGEHTIVLLGPNLDTSSELSMRYLSRFLSQDNRVVILDILGKGFSDDTDKKRSADNVAGEMKEALEKIVADDAYIIMACEYAGNYALRFQELYPDKVKAVIGINMVVPQHFDATVDAMGMRRSVYRLATRRKCRQQLRMQKALVWTGYSRWQFAMYESYFMSSILEPYIENIEELFIWRAYQETSMQEEILLEENCAQIQSEMFPEDLPVLLMIDYVSGQTKLGDGTYRSVYDSRISNPDKQLIKVMEGNPFFYFYKGSAIASQVRDFIEDQL